MHEVLSSVASTTKQANNLTYKKKKAPIEREQKKHIYWNIEKSKNANSQTNAKRGVMEKQADHGREHLFESHIHAVKKS